MLSTCHKVCIIFTLFLVINFADARCSIRYKPNGRSLQDQLNINSGKGPLIYTYKSKEPEIRYPIVIRDELCLFFSDDDTKQPDLRLNLACPGRYVRIEGDVSFTTETTYLTASSTSPKLRFIFNSTNLSKVWMDPSTSVKCTGNTTHEMRIGRIKRNTQTYPIVVKLNGLYTIPIYRIFKDKDNRSQMFAQVKIISSIEYRPKFDESSEYKVGLIYIPNRINFTDIYRREYQIQRFKQLGVDEKSIEEYFSDYNHLVKGQLVSRDDLFYNAQQMSTYYYENTIPVWYSIYEGNWKLVSDIIRKSADQTATDWEVFTYPFGDLRIKNGSALYFGYDKAGLKVTVPRILVKIAFSSANPKHGKVFHIVNDPHINDDEWLEILDPQKGLCKHLVNCKEDYPDFLVAAKGLTFCCSLEDSKIADEFQELLDS